MYWLLIMRLGVSLWFSPPYIHFSIEYSRMFYSILLNSIKFHYLLEDSMMCSIAYVKIPFHIFPGRTFILPYSMMFHAIKVYPGPSMKFYEVIIDSSLQI